MPRLDPITLAVLKGRLEQIADEMDATIFIEPDLAGEVDRFGKLLIARAGPS